jgi:hypothetical protein
MAKKMPTFTASNRYQNSFNLGNEGITFRLLVLADIHYTLRRNSCLQYCLESVDGGSVLGFLGKYESEFNLLLFGSPHDLHN